jgi:hypothetical protein
VRLDVGETTSEKLRNPFNGQRFRHVNILAAAIVAPARQAFGIFVGEDRALRFQHRAADVVFGGDQLDIVALTAELEPQHVRQLRIGLGQRC